MIDYEKQFEEENKDTITDRSLGEYYQRFKFWLKSQLEAKDIEIDELKGEVSILAEISAYDIGVFKRMKDELETHRAVIAKSIPVDIAYTGSTNIITNLPNALYGKFILLGLNEVEDNDY